MPDISDIYAGFRPATTSRPACLEVVAGVVVANVAKSTATQNRFNRLIASIEASRAQSETLRRVVDTQRPAHQRAMQALAAEIVQLQKRWVAALDTGLRTHDLTTRQKQQASCILVRLCEQMEYLGDEAIDTALARYRSPEDLADRAQAEQLAAKETKAFMEGHLGKNFAGQDFKNPADVFRAAMEHAHAREAAREKKRQAKKARRMPSAQVQAAAQKQLDAQSILRTIYRQLASALHPDRATDAPERDRKTALMKDVNAAYERKDLTALLRMQLQIAQIDASKLAALSDEKLKTMCVLLETQYTALLEDIDNQRRELAHDFGYSSRLQFCEHDLKEALAQQQKSLQDEAAWMQEDLARVQDHKGYKTWLKEQTRITKAAHREANTAVSMDDIIFEMMRKNK